MTRISIALATYNGAPFLREQLASLAAQSAMPHELQVGDDGSTDETLAILAEFAPSAPFPVHVHCNPRNLGFGENFIQTAKRCSGGWIVYCDQDDVWLPGKLEWSSNQIDKGPSDLALIAHNAMVTDEELRPIKKLYSYPAEARTAPLGLPPEWACIGATQLFRRDLITAIPSDRRVSFPWHRHRQTHDGWTTLIANCVGTVLRSDRPLVLYRRHGSTVTDQAKSAEPPTWWRFQGSGYSDRASYLEEVSALLAELAVQSNEPYAKRLADASQAIEAHAALLADRGDALTAAALPDRLAALRRVVRAGGYRRGYRWNFGKARLIKDLVGSFVAPYV
jgi:glycosyltransferase involved in cell wall biosynthesis